MKVAVSSSGRDMQSIVEPRFGRSPWFLLVDTESGQVTALDNSGSLDSSLGSGIATARNLAGLGVDLVLTGMVGPKAVEVLAAAGVTVLEGTGGTVDEVIRRYKFRETAGAG